MLIRRLHYPRRLAQYIISVCFYCILELNYGHSIERPYVILIRPMVRHSNGHAASVSNSKVGSKFKSNQAVFIFYLSRVAMVLFSLKEN